MTAPDAPLAPHDRVRLRGSRAWRVVRRVWRTEGGAWWCELAPHGRERTPTPVPVARVTADAED